MHVGLNLIFLVPGETGGMEVYARELIEGLSAEAGNVRFTAFVNRVAAGSEDLAWARSISRVTVPVDARSRLQWVLGEQALLPRLAARERVDVLHSLASTAPARGPMRRVVTVHDLIYAAYPEAHTHLRSIGMRVLVPLAVRRSQRVIAISQSTKLDLERLLGTPTEKIDVVPQGLGQMHRSHALPAGTTRARFELGDREVVLSLSAKRPHKNLLALLDALALIPAERRPLLVLPGYPTWHESELRVRATQLGIGTDIRFLGWISEEELEGLWGLASAFVYPSLYEGFGLPVLEAMARGVPVACSNASSLPEVAGDAALLFDPRSAAEIASALERLLNDSAEAQRLRGIGIERAKTFTWRRTARLTLESYARSVGLAQIPASWTSSL